MAYELTKLDVAALRKADHLIVRVNGKDDTAVYTIKTKKPTVSDPYASDQQHIIPVPVRVCGRWDENMSGVTAFDMMWLYPSQHCHASSILATLRAGDEISFDFQPDYHTTQGMKVDSPYHADVLCLNVRRKEKMVARFELSHTTCLDNSARMVRGLHREYSIA